MKNNPVLIACAAASRFTMSQYSLNPEKAKMTECPVNYSDLTAKSMTTVDVLPAFPEGSAGLNDFLSKHLILPDSLKGIQLNGKVYVSFVVNENGKVVDVEMADGPSPEFKSMFESALSSMPSWSPGIIGSTAVKTHYVLPVSYIFK